MLRFLLGRSPGALIVAVLLGLLSGATSAGLVAAVHHALADLSSPHALLLGAFAILCVLNPLTRAISEYVLLGIGQSSVMELRLRLTRQILATPLARLEALGSHRVLATLVDDVNTLSLALVQLPAVSVLLAILAGCLAYLAWLSLPLFGLLMGVMAIGAVSYQLPLLAGERRFQAAREERDRLFDHLRNLTGGIQELKLHNGRAAAFVGLVRRSSHTLYRLYVLSYTIFNVSANWGHLLFFVVLGCLLFGGPLWLDVGTSVLTGYALTLLYLMSPLQGLLDSLPIFSRAGVALRKIDSLGFELEHEGSELASVEAPTDKGWQRLELRGVGYAYPGEGDEKGFVVGPLDLTFKPGELVFLVGGNGSGKTTFAKLLTGLYAPQAGELILDGEPVSEAQLGAYRQLFSMVFVTPHLFDELLGLHRPDLDLQAADYLEALELDRKVSIRDGKLSTLSLSQGQKKRLALLVAYLEDRPFYIFDEWAADQDPTFREIFYSRILPELQARGKTLLVISHDDRYYGMANRILKLELGRIVHDGSYVDLLASEHREAGGHPAAEGEVTPLAVMDRDSRRASAGPSALAGPTQGSPPQEQEDRPFNWRRPILLAAVGLALVVGVGGFLAQRWFQRELEQSLPQLTGEVTVAGIDAPVAIERDAFGIPTVRGGSRRDVAFATGFLHAQERFFQMDLLRRRAAGELAELVGPAALDADIEIRRHRFRARATEFFEASAPDLQTLVLSYVRGVKAGLAQLESRPFEYLVLGTEPRPWQPEDSFLVLISMFVQLHEANGRLEEVASRMQDCLSPALFEFLTPAGSEWDAPIVGEPLQGTPIPGPGIVDLRHRVAAKPPTGEATESPSIPGSNAWVLAPNRTSGGAWLANELHLDLSLPNLWYRATFAWSGSEDVSHQVTGVTLPGLPSMVLGSNGKIAWGLTNSVVDNHDLVVLERNPRDPDTYLSPEGPRPLRQRREVVSVRGGGSETVDVVETHWGPIVGEDHLGRPYVSSWTAHHAVDLESQRLETVSRVEDALTIARRSGAPAMNFFVADVSGRIGWTLMGRLPERFGTAGRVAASWADGRSGWRGLLDPDRVPRVLDPVSGQLWNANNRMVAGEELDLLGDGGYPLGARARQIRDALHQLDQAGPADMATIQLDDRALFMERWQQLLLAVLDEQAVATDARRLELRRQVEAWGGRASVHSAGYRLVRSFRLRVARAVFTDLLAPCREGEEELDYTGTFRQYEEPLWKIVQARPTHLLPPRHDHWQDLFLEVADGVVEHFSGYGPLAEQTWGRRNTVSVQHPLSLAIPIVGRWLDTPPVELPGDDYMPRVQNPAYGATLRMAVSPGREAEGYLHMPGGQSGHPLSPHYRNGHQDWVEGNKVPFLPGTTVTTLHLLPD